MARLEETCHFDDSVFAMVLGDACGFESPAGKHRGQMRAVRSIGVVVFWRRRTLGSQRRGIGSRGTRSNGFFSCGRP